MWIAATRRRFRLIPRSTVPMIRILFLAANPRHTQELDLRAEADAIAVAMRRAVMRDEISDMHFEIEALRIIMRM